MGNINRKNIFFFLQGELTITSDMEDLENALFLDQIPSVWMNRAYPSLLGLGAWFSDLLLRIRELETWTTDFVVSIFLFKEYIIFLKQLKQTNRFNFLFFISTKYLRISPITNSWLLVGNDSWEGAAENLYYFSNDVNYVIITFLPFK